MTNAGKEPVIKGIFVNAHVRALREQQGAEAVVALERCYGKPVVFSPNANVPIAEEITLLECVFDILHPTPLGTMSRDEAVGRMHFRNFTSTGWWGVLASLFPKTTSFKYLIMHCYVVGERVFNGVTMRPEDVGARTVKIVMGNCPYAVDHMRGIFLEWMEFLGHKGVVLAKELGVGNYEFVVEWTE